MLNNPLPLSGFSGLMKQMLINKFKGNVTWLRIPTGRRRSIWLLKKKWAKHLNTGLTRTMKQVGRVVRELRAYRITCPALLNQSVVLPSPFHGNTVQILFTFLCIASYDLRMIEFWKEGRHSEFSLLRIRKKKTKQNKRVSSLELYVSKRHLSNFYL